MTSADSPVNLELQQHEPNAEKIIVMGTCLRFMDMNLEMLKNDSQNGIAPSIRYGIVNNTSFDCVSVTAISNEPKLADRMRRVAEGNWGYESLLNNKPTVEESGLIPLAYILDFKEMAKLPNVTRIQQNWGLDPEPIYEGIEKYISTPGSGNYWEGEVRIYFKDPQTQPCISLETCKAILIRESDLGKLQKWIAQLRQEQLNFPHVPVFSHDGSKFLAQV